MKRFVYLVLTILLLLAFVPMAAFAHDDGLIEPGREFTIREGAEYSPGEIIVKFKSDAGGGMINRLRESIGQVSSESLGSDNLELLKTSDDIEQAITRLRASGLVEYAEPNYRRKMDAWPADPPDDPAYAASQWNFKAFDTFGGINMPDAWPVETGDPGAVVAILDTGIAYRTGGGYTIAPDLTLTTFVTGYDFVNSDNYPSDDNGHGTHVCGTVAQSTNNATGAAGVAPGCGIMPVKVLDNDGGGLDSWIIEGIHYAADHGAEIINMSLSGPDYSEALEDAVDYAYSNNTLVCASSGNDNEDTVGYPAGCPSCVAVGATNRNRERASSYSNYGDALDVMAPGGEDTIGIVQQTFAQTGNPDTFALVQYIGTSMACPHFAGVSALVKSVHPDWNASQVRGVVASTCNDIGGAGWDKYCGWGLINAEAALTATDADFPQPSISGVSSSHGTEGRTVTVTVTGTGLDGENNIMLKRPGENSIVATNISVKGPAEVNCKFDLTGAQTGLWDMYVGNTGLNYDRAQGAFEVEPSGNYTWYLAEGCTNYGYEEFVLLQNPNGRTVNAQLTFMTSSGGSAPYPVQVPAGSRVTVKVNDIVPNADVSTQINADGSIICERAMYWEGREEGTDSIGVQAPSYTWYLAEGSTDHGFNTFLLIQNPNDRATQVLVTYMTPDGAIDKEIIIVNANSRYTINVADDLPSEDMSFRVLSSRRIIAERSMYWDGKRGGHDSIGTNSPSEKWYLAEGTTAWGFDEYVLLQNPNKVDARAQITYMTKNGSVREAARTIPAYSRVTVHVNEIRPNEDLSVQVESNIGIVVERAMYWDNGTGKAGHCSIAVPQPREECLLAEGSTAWGFDEWILIQNPNSTAADVGITYMTSDGAVQGDGLSIDPGSRITIHVNSELPAIDTSAEVYSNLPVIAERSMYWNSKGAGHVSQGLMR